MRRPHWSIMLTALKLDLDGFELRNHALFRLDPLVFHEESDLTMSGKSRIQFLLSQMQHVLNLRA